MTPSFVRNAVAVSLFALASACSSSSGGDSSVAGDGGTELSDDEQTTFGTGGGSLASQQEKATLADRLFDFDPTIDPAATPEANAAAVGANTKANLGTCGQVSVAGATVSVDFGAPPGCTLQGGAVISGKVSVVISKSAMTTSLALTLTDVVGAPREAGR